MTRKNNVGLVIKIVMIVHSIIFLFYLKRHSIVIVVQWVVNVTHSVVMAKCIINTIIYY